MKTLLLFALFLPALNAAPLPEGVDDDLLMQTTIHLYRWVLDENDLDQVMKDKDLVYWVRELKHELDDGDQSRMFEIWMPQMNLQVVMRKADYEIEKMGIRVRNKGFKVSNILRGLPPESAEGYMAYQIPYAEIEAFAFAQRAHAVYPEGKFLEALREASRTHLMEYYQQRGEEPPSGQQRVFLSPLSPVSNEIWVFWETGGKLLRLSSDSDLEDPALWEKQGLTLRIFDLREQTVVHLSEAKGSNAYMTRDQVGRYLFNCLVLGKKMDLIPPAGE
ncbi:hypothetical protein P0Y35_10540 [Kiritimatiellaeota bacterium B1221]|nr:hypothetical protein [Kiritimatiellaeota bacterium B1221]